jgi:hypothetical protein
MHRGITIGMIKQRFTGLQLKLIVAIAPSNFPGYESISNFAAKPFLQ